MELGSAARDETEEFSLCQLAECARTVWFEKLGNRAQQMKADVFIEGWRRRLIGYEHQRSVEQTERIEYFLGFPDAALLRPLFRHHFSSEEGAHAQTVGARANAGQSASIGRLSAAVGWN
jgi:hypothetical protein